MSPPSRGAWIEMAVRKEETHEETSPPSRGAWIEIVQMTEIVKSSSVAPLAGGVD